MISVWKASKPVSPIAVFRDLDWISAIAFIGESSFVAGEWPSPGRPYDGRIAIYAKWTRQYILSVGLGRIFAIRKCGRRHFVVSGASDRVALINAEQGKIERLLKSHSVFKKNEIMRHVYCSDDGGVVAAGGDDNVIRVWRLSAARDEANEYRFASRVAPIGFNVSTNELVVVSDSGNVGRIHLPSDRVKPVLFNVNGMRHLDVDYRGTFFAIESGSDGNEVFSVYDILNISPVRTIRPDCGDGGELGQFRLGMARLATVCGSSETRLYSF
jgi:WD40 repeat protein